MKPDMSDASPGSIMTPRRHHSVSQALLRNWAGSAGHVAVLDKVARKKFDANPVNVFVGKDLYSVQQDEAVDASLELEWSRIEGETLADVGLFIGGDVAPRVQHSIRATMALHLTRSRPLVHFRSRSLKELINEAVLRAPENERLVAAYVEQYGIVPADDEIREALRQHATEQAETNSIDVEVMRWAYNRAIDLLARFDLQRAHAERFSQFRFFIGDAPVVVLRHGRVSTWEKPIAIGDADEVFMPLSPTVAVALSNEPVSDIESVSNRTIARINRASFEACDRQLVARRQSEFKISLGGNAG